MVNLKNTYASASNAERQTSFAIVRADCGGETYYVGGFRKNGNIRGKPVTKARTSTVIDKAVIYPDRDSANEVATSDERLHYFRVVPLIHKEYADGFQSRWWL